MKNEQHEPAMHLWDEDAHFCLRCDCDKVSATEAARCAETSSTNSDELIGNDRLLEAYAVGRKDEAEQEAMDSKRWRMLPAFIEAHQIDYVALLRDIDAALAEPQSGDDTPHE